MIGVQIARAAQDEDKRLVYAYLYNSTTKDGEPIWDAKNAHIPPDVLEDCALRALEEGGIAGVMHVDDANGEPVQIGKIVQTWCWTAESWAAFGITDYPYQCTWMVTIRVDNEDVWQKIKKGEYPQLSLRARAKVRYLP